MAFNRKEYMKEYMKRYCQRPKWKEYHKEYNQRKEVKEYQKEYRKENSEKIRKLLKEYNQKPNVKERREVRDKKYYKDNNEKIRRRNKKYNQLPEVKERRKEYNQRPEVKERRKEYNQRPEVIERRRKRFSKWQKKRYDEDKKFNISMRLRSNVNRAFNNFIKKKKMWKSSKYGIDYAAIINHLQPFPEDISLYHIDHIKPLLSFNFINEDGSQNLKEIQKAFAPKNHQWLLAEDNLRKGCKIIKQSQLIINK